MKNIKELTIQPTPNGFLPNLPLNGKWLENIGFTAGVGVRVTLEDSCLTLTIDNSGTDLQVESRNLRHRPRTTLTLNAFWLKRYGFNLWDKVGLTFEYGKIQIQKINRFSKTG